MHLAINLLEHNTRSIMKTYSVKLGDETLATAGQPELENVERSESEGNLLLDLPSFESSGP